MAQSDSGQTDSATQRPKKFHRFHLSDQAKCRKALQQLLNEFRTDADADTGRFRASVYCVKAISDILSSSDLEQRIAELENYVKGAKF